MYSWWQRNRRKILVGSGLAASGVLLYKFAERKLDEFREAEAQETLKRARKQHHFDANQRTCNMTALSMATTLGDALKAKVDTDKLFHLLQVFWRKRVRTGGFRKRRRLFLGSGPEGGDVL